MNIAYFGNHNVGVGCLRALLNRGIRPCLVVVLPRSHEHLEYDSVEEFAAKHNLEVHVQKTPQDSELFRKLELLELDYILSVAWRFIFPRTVLEMPKLGAVNMHGSLLPRCRGAHPTNWAIISGETVTGVTLHYMDSGIDTGDIIIQESLPIDIEDTAYSLRLKQDKLSVALIDRFAHMLTQPTTPIPRTKQDERQATTFRRRTPADGLLHWSQIASPQQAINIVRAQTRPYPGAFCRAGGGVLRIWKVEEFRIVNKSGQIGEILQLDGMHPVVKIQEGAVILTDYELEGDAPELLPGTILE